MYKAVGLLSLFLLGYFPGIHAQQGGDAAASAPAAAAPQQKPIFLDVVVSDRSGKPLADLEPFDFSVLDDNQPRKVLGFRRTDGVAGSKTEPPVEVILVLDEVNMPYQVVTRLRLEADKFLRANDGHLTQPVSIYVFADEGLRVQPAPSKDGNGLADMLDHSVGAVRARDITGGVYSLEEQFKDSYKAIAGMAENLARKPGRKVVLWLGPGWPLLTERFFIQTDVSRGTYYKQLASLQNKLREARITLYCVYATAGLTNTLYEGYVKPVREIRKMEIGDMALQVLALHTGGRVLGPSNDVKELIDSCVAEIGEFYTLAIMPPPAAGPDEYHDLKVQVNRPDATVKTVAGYYNEPAGSLRDEGWSRIDFLRERIMVARVGSFAVLLLVLAAADSGALGQAPATPSQAAPDPALTQRPLPKPQGPLAPAGKIKLDVVVDDGAGKPVTGLEPWDFKILDNGSPRKVLSFRSYDGVQVKPDPPVEVILVVDTVNMLFQQVSFVRGELDQFLRQNGGQLKQPMTLVLLTEKGIQVQPRPSTDGNAIASVADGIKGSVRVLDQAMGSEGQLEQFQVSAKALENIAQNEARKPGRKLLIWAAGDGRC